jgi:hypothetical protein
VQILRKINLPLADIFCREALAQAIDSLRALQILGYATMHDDMHMANLAAQSNSVTHHCSIALANLLKY